MQSPARAAKELRRAVQSLGLKGVMIGSHIDGVNLDAPELEEIWEVAAELDALIFIHPQKPAGGDRLKSYYLTNLIGNPLETTIAAASLVFGGVFQRHPNLKVLLSHGGGFTPYQMGRFIHGWEVRSEAKVHLKVSPADDLNRFYYDTLTHSQPTLRSLIEWAGPSRVLFGTDFPFDMGEFDCAARVKDLHLAQADEASILGGVTAALLNLTGAGVSKTLVGTP
jgi:aminocarboxymuconate-semialdehyde decarboxylase